MATISIIKINNTAPMTPPITNESLLSSTEVVGMRVKLVLSVGWVVAAEFTDDMLSVGLVVDGGFNDDDDDDNDGELCMLEVVVCDNVDDSLLEVKDDESVVAIKNIDIIYGKQ